MRKWMTFTLLLAAIPVLSFGGFGGEDVGKLRPIQVVSVKNRDGGVVLQTDTEDLGQGEDVNCAVRNMKERSIGYIFLDTADYLLIEPEAEIWLPQLKQYLRPSCSLCYASEPIDLGLTGQFLQLHEPALNLSQYEAGKRNFSRLILDEGRMCLVQP